MSDYDRGEIDGWHWCATRLNDLAELPGSDLLTEGNLFSLVNAAISYEVAAIHRRFRPDDESPEAQYEAGFASGCVIWTDGFSERDIRSWQQRRKSEVRYE